MSHALLAALPCFATARPSAANRPRQKANPKTQNRNHKANGGNRTSTSTTTSVGFSRERKDPLWQCVQGCGACCKLDKGPAFPSPEEVFEDPSDIQGFPLACLICCIDTIKAIYGAQSQELDKFNHAIRSNNAE
ncbi:hypothetical protein RJ639_023569 [Escallonia herrerae]|uniref:Uncharacterized protein n=1 Tax=Escallonia herrerae TaxID=1293975 RepID=A0AA88UZ94_9ASTE|nr:hypothetical protein RJ639_023569 [Escallonia herrerae]